MPAAARLPLDDEPDTFTFDQLGPSAKETAREWFLKDYPHHDWHEFVFEDVTKIAAMLGITIDTHRVTPHGGRVRYDPSIWFSGFWTQWDGASFDGRWSAVDEPLGALGEVLDHAPLDERLHEIALDLLLLAERCNRLMPDTAVRISSSRLHHWAGASFSIDMPTPEHVDEASEMQVVIFNALCTAYHLTFEEFSRDITAALRAFMAWIYEQLREEYQHLTSDEVVDETLRENDYAFDENGRPA